MSGSHKRIWAVDSEWGFRDLRVDHPSAWEPVVFCATDVQNGQKSSFWGRDPLLANFVRDHTDDLFVAHSAVAEMKYLLRLGIDPPLSWFDTYAAWRYHSNQPIYFEAGLSHALHALGLPSLAPMVKEALRKKILELRFDPNSTAERREIIEYCFSDCDACKALYEKLVSKIKPDLMALWSHYLRALARMELRGIPFDVETYDEVRKHRDPILHSLMNQVNIAVRDTVPDADLIFRDGSFNKKALIAWSRVIGINWPVKISPANGRKYHPVDDEILKSLEVHHPVIAMVREVLKTRQNISRRTLVVDPITRRHHFDTVPFRSVTGRNQPTKFIFQVAKWYRHLIVPESPDHVLVYVDFVAQEFGIAAALSKDPEMKSVYTSGDCHLEFAIRAGAVPPGATEENCKQIRKLYKRVNLGVLYGETAYGIAQELAVSQDQAERILSHHQTLFHRYWDWSDRLVRGVYYHRRIVSPNGWRSRVPGDSKPTTWRNWPMQATGAELMRLFITYLDRQDVQLLAPVHDGFLLTCRRYQLDDLDAAINFAGELSVRQVLCDFPLRWDTRFFDDRFEDEDGSLLWTQIQQKLQEVHHERHSSSIDRR